MTNLDPIEGMIESMLLDLQIYRLKRVGRRNMTLENLWREWIRE